MAKLLKNVIHGLSEKELRERLFGERVVTCPIHPEIRIDNETGNFCPICFEVSERFSGNRR